MKKFISWRRVSTAGQGKSGLGLQAQKDIIKYFIDKAEGELLHDYEEVYTGKDLKGCAELQKAIQHAKRERATLIIAKTDRFRSTIEALQVLEEMDGNIIFCDLPNSDKFTLTLFFALAEREALIVSIRTKAALAARKRRGEKTGGSNEVWGSNNGADRTKALESARKISSDERRRKAQDNDSNVLFWEYAKDFGCIGHIDFEKLSDRLNAIRAKTPTGLEYNPVRAKAMYNKCRELYRN